ncbi:hypothetical protein HYW94_01505 [Candidatus Uhrbacteria bacterium]|nr:hypothetical protein [Candidatus Uhrbacteria bacterium]
MFKKSLPLALVAIAGCVASVPQQTQKADTTAQTATSAPTVAQSPTPVPTPTPSPTPTPVPTPLPDNILKINFVPVEGVAGLERVSGIGGYLGKRQENNPGQEGLALSASGDMYIQTIIPHGSTPLLCSTCDTELVQFRNFAIFKKTSVKDEFEYIALGQKKTVIPGQPDSGKTFYGEYPRRDFAFSKLTEAASVSVAPWVVKSVDVAKKEISFNTSVWTKNTGSLKLSDVASADIFGLDDDKTYDDGPDYGKAPCVDATCENERALTVVRERTAFTGTTAYFIGRTSASVRIAGDPRTSIFRVHETGEKEVVGKNIVEYFKSFGSSYGPAVVYHFVYSQSEKKFYILTSVKAYGDRLYRISEEALVP